MSTSILSGQTYFDGLAVEALIRLRWMAVLGQLVTLAVASFVLDLVVMWSPVLAFIGLTALSNVMLTVLRRSRWSLGVGAVPHVMVWDTLILCALLYWTGGSQNPFSLFLLLNAVLAALTLGRFSAWLLMVLSVGGLLLLTTHHHPLLTANGQPLPENLQNTGRITAFFLVCGILIYLVQSLRGRLRQEMRQRKAADERLEAERRFHSVATLAAGAAHEMGSPLATIAVASREIEIALQEQTTNAELKDMVLAIRSQVSRCQSILARLRPAEPEEPRHSFSLGELAALLRRPLGGEDQKRLHFLWNPEHVMAQPQRVLCEALGNLIRNALQASASPLPVEVSAESNGQTITFVVRDHGPGVPDILRPHLGEPFFTTKAPGSGIGLGLHLVKLLARQLGGSLVAKNASEGGSEFSLSLPR